MKLNEFQRGMADFVFQDQQAKQSMRAQLKNYSSEQLRARLAIYKNNTFHSLIEGLKDLYPSVIRTIGDELFTASGRQYIEAHPPASLAMVDFAHDFPDFLQNFAPMQSLAYIADLARVDLLRHQSYHAADDGVVTAEKLAALAPDQLAQAIVRPHDSARLMRSPYAVFDIWRLAQNEIDNEINADNPQCVLSIRPDSDVLLYLLDSGTHAFLRELATGKTIQNALSCAGNAGLVFDAPAAISFLVQSGFITQLIGE